MQTSNNLRLGEHARQRKIVAKRGRGERPSRRLLLFR